MQEPALLVGDILRTAAARSPTNVAVIHGDIRCSFAELQEQADHLAGALASQGVIHGDRVAWRGRSRAEAVSLFFALANLGAVFAPVNPRLSDDEFRGIEHLVGPRLVLDDAALDELLNTRHGPPSAWPEVDERDAQSIFFTSGTTGHPKGVVLSHRANRLRAMIDASPLPEGPTVCTLAQFHKGGWGAALEAWMAGDTVVYADDGDPHNILRSIHATRAARVYCIPAVWRRVLAVDRQAYDLGSLRWAGTGTSPTSAAFLEELSAAFPAARITVVYGSTESGPSCRLSYQDVLRKPGSVGPACPGVALRLSPHGELLIRSPHLFSGYFRSPELTAEVLRDGWYHSGELAERDEEGYFRIIGRIKDVIRTGGETVAPAEVEAVIQEHPSVLDAAVAGVPDEAWGEKVAAFVVLRPETVLGIDELRQYCATRLAAFKQPRALYALDAIPRTGPTQQVQRRHLARHAAEADHAG